MIETVESIFAPIFKPIAVFLYNIVSNVSLGVAKGIFVGLLVLLMIWVISLKSEGRAAVQSHDAAERDESIDKSSPKLPFTSDLRLWAVLILASQVALYLFFG